MLRPSASPEIRRSSSRRNSMQKYSPSNILTARDQRPDESPHFFERFKLNEEIIRSVTKIDNLANITELCLNGNSKNFRYRIKIISGLQNLMNLRELNLSHNDIEKMECLNNLKCLKSLNISFNKISKIEGISALKQLEVLNLSDNLIENIPSTLANNVSLVEIRLTSNLISSKEEFYHLKQLSKLTCLDCSNNPVAEHPEYKNAVLSTLKKLKYLDGKAPDRRGRRSSSQDAQITTSNFIFEDPTALDMKSPENRNPINVRSSYEIRLLSTQTKLNQISMLNNQVQLMSTDRKGVSPNRINDNSNVRKLSFTDKNDFQNEVDRSKISVRESTPLNSHRGPLADLANTDSALDMKSRTTPLVANKSRVARFSAKEDFDFLANSQYEANVTNLSNIEQNSPRSGERSQYRGRSQHNIKESGHTRLNDIAQSIFQVHSKIDLKVQDYNKALEQMNQYRQSLSDLVENLNQVMNIMNSSYMNANKREEREILLMRTELLAEMRDFIACEVQETNTHMKYYNLVAKIRSLISFQQEDVLSIVQSLEKEAAIEQDRLKVFRERIEQASLTTLKLEATIKSKLTQLKFPVTEEEDEFYAEQQAINEKFKQASLKFHKFEKLEISKEQYFEVIKELCLESVKYFRSLISIKQFEHIDNETYQRALRDAQSRAKTLIPLGDEPIKLEKENSDIPEAQLNPTKISRKDPEDNRKELVPPQKNFQGSNKGKLDTSNFSNIDKSRRESASRENIANNSQAQSTYFMGSTPIVKASSGYNRKPLDLSSQESFLFQGSLDKSDMAFLPRETANREIDKNDNSRVAYALFEPKEQAADPEYDLIILELREELAEANKRVAYQQAEIEKLTSELNEAKKVHHDETSYYKSVLHNTTVQLQDDKANYERGLHHLAEICDKNTLKLNEIHNKLNSLIEKNQHGSTSQLSWILEAQSFAFQEIVKQNAELTQALKTYVQEHKPLLTLEKPTEETCNQPFKESTIVDHGKSVVIEESQRYQHRSSPKDEATTEPIKIEDFQDETIKTNDIKLFTECDIGESVENNFPVINISNIKKTNQSFTSDKTPRLGSIPKSKQSRMKDTSFKATRELISKITECMNVQDSRPTHPQISNLSNSNNQLSVSEILKDQPQSNNGNGSKNEISFKKKTSREGETEGHSHSNSLTSLQKILFGSNHEVLQSREEFVASQTTEPAEPKPLSEYFQKLQKAQQHLKRATTHGNLFQPVLSAVVDENQSKQLSNLQETIAAHLIQNSGKSSEKVLRKVSSNILAYKNHKPKINPPKAHNQSFEKTGQFRNFNIPVNRLTFDENSNNPAFFLSPRNLGRATSPNHNEQTSRSPLSAREGLTKQLSRNNLTSNYGQTTARPVLDLEKIYRKAANYQQEPPREITINMQKLLNEKRKVLESPQVTNYCENFDFNSPHHPKHLTQQTFDGTRKVNNSGISVGKNSYGRQSLGGNFHAEMRYLGNEI